MVDPTAPESTPLTLLREFAVRDSFETFRDQMGDAMLYPQKKGIRKYCIQKTLGDIGATGLFVEFGVWRGHGVNQFARLVEASGLSVTGFDSFVGLEEDWSGHARGAEKGRYGLDGMLPDVRGNVLLVKGWVQDTLPDWLKAQKNQSFSFIHFDMDTYTPTAFALDAVRPHLVENTVILFDELYGYPGWRNHEYKALTEVLPADSYKFIAFSEQAVAIQMTRKP